MVKIYLCSKCNRKIPRAEVIGHRQACGRGSDIGLTQGLGGKVKRGCKRFFIGLAAVLLIGLAWWLGERSFQSLASMRRLELVPEVAVSLALPGEIQLNGQALAAERTLRAPRSKTACLYYRYTVERRSRDSEGRTRWTTITDRDDSVPFRLQDQSGELRIKPDAGVDFRVRSSYRTRQGDRRYTEYRIDPGDRVFVFGYAVRDSRGMEVRFDLEGDYDSIVSEYGQTGERTRQGRYALVKNWGGLVSLGIALSLLLAFFGVHRVVVHFALLTLLMVLYLGFFGLHMMKTDLHAAASRLERHEKEVRRELSTELAGAGFSWDGQWASLPRLTGEPGAGLSAAQMERLRQLRLNLARAAERVRCQRSGFPERWLAFLWRVPRGVEIPLSEDDRISLQELEAGLPPGSPSPAALIVIAVSLLVGGLGFVFGFRHIRFKRCIENLPTTPTAGAAYGLAEFKGMVEVPESGEHLKAPLSRLPCVQYHYKVEEKRGSGKNSKWVTILDQTLSRPFFCRDAEGSLLVNPVGAKVYTAHRNHRTSGRTRYSETRLEPADPLYAIGECVIEPVRGDRVYLNRPQDRYPFILSNLTENQVMLKVAAAGIAMLHLSLAGVMLAALLLLSLAGSFGPANFLTASIVAPVFMLLVTMTLHYNDLVFLRERLRRNRSNIDVSLKKRTDLVPLLEEVTRSFMDHEQSLQTQLTNLRKLYGGTMPTDSQAVGTYMEVENAALGRLIALVERYPELKSHRLTAELMHSLVVLENELAFTRNGYNDAVERYNTRIQSFPDLLLAGSFRFREEPFIHAETELVHLPPDLQSRWEKDRIRVEPPVMEAAGGGAATDDQEIVAVPEEQGGTVAMLAAAGGDGAVQRTAADGAGDAVAARVRIYALLLNEEADIRAVQLESIATEESPEIREQTDLAAADLSFAGNDKDRLRQAEGGYEILRSMSADGYRAFRHLINVLMEADQAISLFQYALQKSMDRFLEPEFDGLPVRPVRHRNYQHILREVSLLLSRLARAEARPGESAGTVFAAGVAGLNHKPESDFTLLPLEECTLAAFDEALEEVAHATRMIRANIFYACKVAVQANREYTTEQAMLIAALADTLGYQRPGWTGP